MHLKVYLEKVWTHNIDGKCRNFLSTWKASLLKKVGKVETKAEMMMNSIGPFCMLPQTPSCAVYLIAKCGCDGWQTECSHSYAWHVLTRRDIPDVVPSVSRRMPLSTTFQTEKSLSLLLGMVV